MTRWILLTLMAALGGCAETSQDAARVAPDADAREIRRDGEGRCWGRTVIPATVETVTEQVLETSPVVHPDGTVLAQGAYRTETRQRILEPRREVAFEAVCPEDLTPEFVVLLQRALAARDIYRGPITGDGDAATVEALRRYQVSLDGPDSPVLSRRAAVELGLVPVRPEEVDELL